MFSIYFVGAGENLRGGLVETFQIKFVIDATML